MPKHKAFLKDAKPKKKATKQVSPTVLFSPITPLIHSQGSRYSR